jgi:outer membrane protein
MITRLLTSAVLSAAIFWPQLAYSEAGSWVVRGGATNSVLAPMRQIENTFAHRHQLGGADLDTSVDDGFSVSLSYFFTNHISVEMLQSRPFQQNLSVRGVGDVGRSLALPPTLTLRYHFRENRVWRPYVGAGFNWLDQIENDLQGQQPGLRVRNTFGLALQAGIYVDLSDRWVLNLETRYNDIDPQLRSGTRNLGTADLDPMVTAFKLGYRF